MAAPRIVRPELGACSTIGVDWESDDATPASWELDFGRSLGQVGGAACNGFLRPGVGIGADRPYDWSLEFGVAFVGL